MQPIQVVHHERRRLDQSINFLLDTFQLRDLPIYLGVLLSDGVDAEGLPALGFLDFAGDAGDVAEGSLLGGVDSGELGVDEFTERTGSLYAVRFGDARS